MSTGSHIVEQDMAGRWTLAVVAVPICVLLVVITNGILDLLAIGAAIAAGAFALTGQTAIQKGIAVGAGLSVVILFLGLFSASISDGTPVWASLLGIVCWLVLAVMALSPGASGGVAILEAILGLGSLAWSLLGGAALVLGVAALLWGGTDDAQIRCIAHQLGASNSLIDRVACVVRH